MMTDILVADVPAGASDSSLAFVSAADKVLVVWLGNQQVFSMLIHLSR